MTILTILALLPPIILMIFVYKEDKVEREPVLLIVKTIIFGIISVIPILIFEILFENIFGTFLDLKSLSGMIIENYIGVALIEEFFKMQACRLSVWKNHEFNYTFDGVVYAVASSIGFAAFENVLYVADGGIGVALLRALTAIPGHTIFAIFMGVHLGLAKYEWLHGNKKGYKYHKRLALLIPVLIHGTYDLMVSIGTTAFVLSFFAFLILMDILAIRTVTQFEREDHEIYPEDEQRHYFNMMNDDSWRS